MNTERLFVENQRGHIGVFHSLLDIILLTHNKLENTKRCVEALYQNTQVPFKLTVIDDSTDLTPEYFSDKDVNYVRPDVDIKSANQAINIGVKLTQSDPFIFLTNSTFVAPDWLTEALRIMERDSKVGVVGFKMLSPQTGVLIESAGFRTRDLDRADRYDSVLEVMVVGWAAVLLRRAALPKLDEDYYIGFRGLDDSDNCLEIKIRGWKVVYNGKGIIYHQPSSSTGGTTLREIEIEENIRRFRLKWEAIFSAVEQSQYEQAGLNRL